MENLLISSYREVFLLLEKDKKERREAALKLIEKWIKEEEKRCGKHEEVEDKNEERSGDN
jgi:hypothetical protein